MSDKLLVPHVDAHLQSGFLTQIWEAKEPLPRVTLAQRILAYAQRGLETVAALPVTNTVSVMTVAVSLLLFSGFLLVLKNVEQVLVSAGSSLYLTAYVKEAADPAEVDRLLEELRSNNAVASAEFIGKEEALNAFRNELGERSALVAGLERENPLPASIDVVLTTNAVDALVARMRAHAVIEEVAYGSEWFEKMQGVMRVVRLLGYTMSAIVLGIVIFLISNTIKLVMYARRQEIEIMQLVGATDTMIRVPFVIGGAVQGLLGSFVGLLGVQLAFLLVRRSLAGTSLFGVTFPELVGLSPGTMGVILLGGMVIGAAASLFALGRHMHV